MKTINCPNCGKPAPADSSNPYRPFCSRRCKLIDLGDWLDESNRIPDERDTGAPWQGNDHSGQPH
ncbi:MAG TPA: DNA gyrase inhibitor YacG [Salinisphaeraceae bacterium]|nr:DNA gyrase inhibitor YacG [Salinisphaeraceae bacterium]